MRSLDLNLLRVFDAVMMERNVTKAAALLCITQPAVSNSLARLREKLKDPLFLKVHGGISPTPRAQAIWPAIREALARIDATLDHEGFDPASDHASFRIAASDYVIQHFIRPLYAGLVASAPLITILLKPHDVRNAVPLLERGEIDLAVGVLPYLGEHIRVAPIDTLRYAGVMRRGHPLGPAPDAQAFLAARHLVVSLSGNTALIDLELAEQGLQRNIALVVNQFSLVPRLIAESDMVSIVPERVVTDSEYRDRLELVALPVVIQPRTMSLIWHERSEGSPEHRWLRNWFISASPKGAGASPA